jgi:hypothetical protein
MKARLFALLALSAALVLSLAGPTASGADDVSWLFDPLQVTQIDLEASPVALSQLAAAPTEYVDAQITLRSGSDTFGPYRVGLKLKGHSTFRQLDGKSAFKVKFAFSVPGQKFEGLKALTLNNMVQDPSMIAEATSSLLLRATNVPTARIGYAYVRLNGADYGLYANVETVDSVLAKRWFPSMQHVYDGNTYGTDVVPGALEGFDVQEGPAADLRDLEALATADAGGAGTWSDRMQPLADLSELTRAWAAEHYIGQWDGYSVGAFPAQPNNYYLESDATGRFSMIISGTDQTWLERAPFGVYGNGLMMRHCAEDAPCRQLYVDALREIAANPVLATIADQARAMRAAIAPWRALDPRKESSAGEGETQADAKIAVMEARPAELAAWLAHPSFVDAKPAVVSVSGGWSDLHVSGAVSPESSPVGGSHVWRLQVTNSGDATAPGVVLDVKLSPNATYGFGQVGRGTGCAPVDGGVRCDLAELGPAGDDTATNTVAIGTNVAAPGEVSLAANASFAGAEQTPDDNTLILRANGTTAPEPVVPRAPLGLVTRPQFGKAVLKPSKPVAGQRVTFSVQVTPAGKVRCSPSVAGKTIEHAESFKAGRLQLSFVVPKTAKGKRLEVAVTLTASGQSAGHVYAYVVR